MLIALILPIFALSDDKPKMEVPSEGRKLRGSDDYSQKTLPIEALKKMSDSFPGEPVARNNTLDEKASRTSTNNYTLHSFIIMCIPKVTCNIFTCVFHDIS
jgi:hypothetical protein